MSNQKKKPILEASLSQEEAKLVREMRLKKTPKAEEPKIEESAKEEAAPAPVQVVTITLDDINRFADQIAVILVNDPKSNAAIMSHYRNMLKKK